MNVCVRTHKQLTLASQLEREREKQLEDLSLSGIIQYTYVPTNDFSLDAQKVGAVWDKAYFSFFNVDRSFLILRPAVDFLAFNLQIVYPYPFVA